MDEIRYFHRRRGQLETEQVYGESFLKWAYGSPLGRATLHAVVKRKGFSRWYGWRMDRAASRAKIQPFIREFGVDASEFLKPAGSFATFNEFFYRKLQPAARPIDPASGSVVFPADGRHLAFQDVSKISGVFVKGQAFDFGKLVDDPALAEKYRHGSLILSRLCPVDYHRFHFPVSGTVGHARLVGGPLFSVSPLALRRDLSYLWTNKRMITPVTSEALGTVLAIEIGATCVGSIRQTFEANSAVSKGDEKGYFEFGGSSTITLFEPGKIKFDEDLLDHASANTEVYARMGEHMGTIATTADET